MLKIGMVFAVFVVTMSTARAAPAFRDDIALDLATLTASSHLAAGHTDNPALLAYAARETAAQGAFALPSETVHSADADLEALQTGRSAATTTGRTDVKSRDAVIATAGLATMNSLHGSAFDRLYIVMQRHALLSIGERYRGLAGRAMPGVRTITEISATLKNRLDALNNL